MMVTACDLKWGENVGVMGKGKPALIVPKASLKEAMGGDGVGNANEKYSGRQRPEKHTTIDAQDIGICDTPPVHQAIGHRCSSPNKPQYH